MKTYKKIALIEFRNCEPFVYQILSNKKITIDKVATYFTKTEGWNENRDNIQLLDDVSTIKI